MGVMVADEEMDEEDSPTLIDELETGTEADDFSELFDKLLTCSEVFSTSSGVI